MQETANWSRSSDIRLLNLWRQRCVSCLVCENVGGTLKQNNHNRDHRIALHRDYCMWPYSDGDPITSFSFGCGGILTLTLQTSGNCLVDCVTLPVLSGSGKLQDMLLLHENMVVRLADVLAPHLGLVKDKLAVVVKVDLHHADQRCLANLEPGFRQFFQSSWRKVSGSSCWKDRIRPWKKHCCRSGKKNLPIWRSTQQMLKLCSSWNWFMLTSKLIWRLEMKPRKSKWFAGNFLFCMACCALLTVHKAWLWIEEWCWTYVARAGWRILTGGLPFTSCWHVVGNWESDLVGVYGPSRKSFCAGVLLRICDNLLTNWKPKLLWPLNASGRGLPMMDSNPALVVTLLVLSRSV